MNGTYKSQQHISLHIYVDCSHINYRWMQMHSESLYHLSQTSEILHEVQFCLAQICIVLGNGKIVLISALALKKCITKGLDFLEGYSHIQASIIRIVCPLYSFIIEIVNKDLLLNNLPCNTTTNEYPRIRNILNYTTRLSNARE
jgi:hypothetical protein